MHVSMERRRGPGAGGIRIAAAGLALGLGLAALGQANGAAAANAPEPASHKASGHKASGAKTAQLPRAAYDGWASYMGTQSSLYSALDQINTSNVRKLKLAWTFPTGKGPPPHFNPLVVKGVMYVRAGRGDLVALNPATGKELWRQPVEGRAGGRGIAYWQSKDGKDRRLLYIADGMLREARADTGAPIANFGEDGKVDLRVGLDGDISKIRPLQTDNPGVVYQNLIIVSLPAGAYAYASPPADIHAYDVRTGKMVWMFHTVPKIGEFGSDTWPTKDREKFGGVHNWSESTIDRQLGIVYIPTGTARYDFYGGNRKGNDLFANSLIALDARTGKRIWHFQAVHHDLWDYDFATAPKLLTIHKDGKSIPAVAQPSKQGFLYVLDRRTGKPIWPIVERPVPASDVPGEQASPTQPFPTLPKPYARQSFTAADINPYMPEAEQADLREKMKGYRDEGLFTPGSLQGTIELPGHNGGANWGSTAVDPFKQRVFVVAKTLPTLIVLKPDDRPQALADMPNAGGDVKPYQSPVNFMMSSNGLPVINPPWSTITAYDLNDGHILWQVPDGDVLPLAKKGITGTGSILPRGSPVATAGGLLFEATSSDRTFRARDAATGKVLWSYDLPAGSEGAPAVYKSGGRQFIVVPVGGDGEFANKLDLPPTGPSQYMAFALPKAAAHAKAPPKAARTKKGGDR